MQHAMSSPSESLVIGADGQIGRAILAALAAHGETALGTVLQGPAAAGHCVLDLASDPQDWPLPRRVSTAYLCAAVTSLDACRRDPEGTALVNVQRTVAMARRLVERGAFVVFLSSNQVYDGAVPFRRQSDPPCPRTEYGRQKAEAERQLLALGSSAAVVRLTKVLTPAAPLLAAWRRALRAGEIIHPFSDMVMAPLSLPFTVAALEKVAAARKPGIYQLSADRDVSYAEAARRLAAGLPAAAALVEPIESRQAGVPAEAVSPHTTLDMTRAQSELGLPPPSVWDALDAA
jgi:dTDP-4-dehydrorhamnose reductase